MRRGGGKGSKGGFYFCFIFLGSESFPSDGKRGEQNGEIAEERTGSDRMSDCVFHPLERSNWLVSVLDLTQSRSCFYDSYKSKEVLLG